MRIFLSVKSLLPSYGGPAFSVSRLAIALSEIGGEVGLWAPDQSAASTPLLHPSSSVQCLTGGPVQALDAFGKIDILHDNGIWMPHNHCLANQTQLRGIPRLVSTRGMLEPWAISHKRWKKRIAWRMYQRRDLTVATQHHASSDAEATNIRHFGFGVPVRTIPNGMDVPTLTPDKSNHDQHSLRRSALFLGRIHPVKGLPMLIKAWSQVRPSNWILNIAGPEERGHLREVRKEVIRVDLAGDIIFLGPLKGQAKSRQLFAADFFVLPSLSESFGMAIAEALAHGLPVLTTTKAPWPNLNELGCGWSVQPTVHGISQGLHEATSAPPDILAQMGAKGRQLIIDRFAWNNIAKEFMIVYESMQRR